MAEFFVILTFIAVMAVAAVVFGGWLIVTTVKGTVRLLMLPFQQREDVPRSLGSEPAAPRCPNDRCRAENASVASFCRRCGAQMHVEQRVPVRRVAMW